jgi:hypothetical protein
MNKIGDTIQSIKADIKKEGVLEYIRRRLWLAVLYLLGHVLNNTVAALLAALGAYMGAVYAHSQETKYFAAELSDKGVGYPALLFSQAQRENKKLKISFSPNSLQHVAVCEYYSDRKGSFREIMNQYLKAYSACFIPVWQSQNHLVIRPNIYKRQLVETVDQNGHKNFWCKCSGSQIPSSERPMRQPPG